MNKFTTVMRGATIGHHIPVVAYLLSHGVPFNILDVNLAINGLLFEHGGSIEKRQLLHGAVHRKLPDCLEVAQMLLDKGPPINTIKYQNHPDSYKDYKYFGVGTPLFEAARCGNVAMAELLLKNGADPLIKNNKGLSDREQRVVPDRCSGV